MKNVSQAKVRTGLLHNSTSSASVEHSDADLFRTWSAFINTLQHVQCLLFFCHMRNASFQCKMNGLLPFTWDNSPCALVTRNVDIVTAGVGPSTVITSQAVKPMGRGGDIPTKNQTEVRPFLENGYRRFIVIFTMAHICSYPEQMNPVHQRPSYFLQILWHSSRHPQIFQVVSFLQVFPSNPACIGLSILSCVQPATPVSSFVVVPSYKEKVKGLSARKSDFVVALIAGVTLQQYVYIRNAKFVTRNYGLGSQCVM